MKDVWDFIREHTHGGICLAVIVVSLVSWRHQRRWPTKDEAVELGKAIAAALTSVAALAFIVVSRNSDLYGFGFPLTVATLYMSYKSLGQLSDAIKPLRTPEQAVVPSKMDIAATSSEPSSSGSLGPAPVRVAVVTEAETIETRKAEEEAEITEAREAEEGATAKLPPRKV